MTLKKYKIIGTFLIFLSCFAFHFAYETFPNTIFSLIFPVNESIWEHMKLLFTPFILYTVIEYLLINKYERINNLYLQLFLIPVVGVTVYLMIYLPIYYSIGENMFVSFVLLFLVIGLQQYLSYHLSLKEEFKYQTTLGILGSLLTFSVFTYLTYLPFKQELFFDTQKEIYGIPEYQNTVYKR